MNKAATRYFAEQAKYLRRDLRAGQFTQAELPEVIAGIWRDDEYELQRSYDIKSLAELKFGILKALPTKKRGVPKKVAKKPKTAKKSKRKSSWWPW